MLTSKLESKGESDKNAKRILIEKDQEIDFLKKFINSLKLEVGYKEKHISQFKSKLTKLQNENVNLRKSYPNEEIPHNKNGMSYSAEINKIGKFSSHNNHNFPMVKEELNNLSEEGDENLKEITVLMKKILED